MDGERLITSCNANYHSNNYDLFYEIGDQKIKSNKWNCVLRKTLQPNRIFFLDWYDPNPMQINSNKIGAGHSHFAKIIWSRQRDYGFNSQIMFHSERIIGISGQCVCVCFFPLVALGSFRWYQKINESWLFIGNHWNCEAVMWFDSFHLLFFNQHWLMHDK